MNLRAALLLWATLASCPCFAIAFDRYHSQEEINDFLIATAASNPALVRIHQLGYSDEGRSIYYAIISKRDPDQLPALYLNGTHHGNEKSSTEAILGLLQFLIESQNDAIISELLSSYAVFLQPLVNPDGHARNIRTDAQGRDPNRDYENNSFRIASIKLVKELSDKVRFRAAAAFHSGMEAVLWPWGNTHRSAPDSDIFYTISRISAEAMGITRYLQSYHDYPTNGEFIDYVYNNHGTLALTFEVSESPAPSETTLPEVVRRSVAGAMAFMLSIMDLDQGNLTLMKTPTTTHIKTTSITTYGSRNTVPAE